MNIPPATLWLILANVVVYFLMMLFGDQSFLWLALWPVGTNIGVSFGPWQLVTYAFLHGGLAHIFFNMFALFMFGSEIERLFGSRWFSIYYLVCIITAAIAQLVVAAVTNAPPYPTIGASGGIFGILLAFGMYFPRRTVMLIFPPIPMPAWVFVTIYGFIELFLGTTGLEPSVAHFAHLGGMVGGFLMIMQRRGWRL
jgi:membrane associated rhomboid family serine protease